MMIRIESREPQVCGTIRYRLSNGWFIDGARVRAHFSQGYRYGIWKPAMPSAVFLGGADTLKAATALAAARQDAADRNLTRMAFGKDYR